MEDFVQAAVEFWDNIFASGRTNPYSRVEMPDLGDAVLQRALGHFGDVRGRTLVDLGCGRGATSLFFAHHGAEVIGVDSSGQAIRNLAEYCETNAIANLKPIECSALDVAALGPVDFVFGSMILHHLEPFPAFAAQLRGLLRPGGRAFFWENNARSSVMIWFREHVVGKLWIPKHGDVEEFPLTPAEVEELRRYFTVTVEYPELLLFRMIPRYLLRGRLMSPFERLDRACYRYPSIREYSYRQCLLVE
jgi:2-polyprenyl-3-methyl-5-hydroxy-6-metoxy-1,4-benzoquinol methylase